MDRRPSSRRHPLAFACMQHPDMLHVACRRSTRSSQACPEETYSAAWMSPIWSCLECTLATCSPSHASTQLPCKRPTCILHRCMHLAALCVVCCCGLCYCSCSRTCLAMAWKESWQRSRPCTTPARFLAILLSPGSSSSSWQLQQMRITDSSKCDQAIQRGLPFPAESMLFSSG